MVKIMAERTKIVAFINKYLEVKNFEDYCVNGLQIEGKADIRKIVAGVSLNLELINTAIKKHADMILVHHGIFGKDFFQIKGVWKKRIKQILTHDINLAGYHLPLDAHPVVGNNILLLKKLGLQEVERIDVGWIGRYDKAVTFNDFVEKVNTLLKTKSYVINNCTGKIRTVGIISGGASKRVIQAIDAGLDLFLSGDIKEDIVDIVKESSISFINAGHYRTEKLGIEALGELVSKEFGVEVEFVEVDNEI